MGEVGLSQARLADRVHAYSPLGGLGSEILAPDGSALLRRGGTAPWTAGTATITDIEQAVAVDDVGNVVASVDTTDWAGPSRVLVQMNPAGQWSIVADREAPLPWEPSTIYGRLCYPVRVLPNGELAFSHKGPGVFPMSFLSVDRSIALDGNVPVVGYDGTVYSIIVEQLPTVSPSGEHWAASVGLLGGPIGPLSALLAVDGATVAEMGDDLPGAPHLGPVRFWQGGGIAVNDHGTWIAVIGFGPPNGNDSDDRVVMDGRVALGPGDPIHAGSSEHWTGRFRAPAINGVGDWMVHGNTDDPDPQRDQVAVLNGTTILARKGDPIDVDGDGAVPDGLFISGFRQEIPNRTVLTDDRVAFLNVTVVDASGVAQGARVLRVEYDDALGADYCASVPSSSGSTAALTARGRVAVSLNDVETSVTDLPANTFGLHIVSLTPGQLPMPGASAGTLCVSGAVGRDLGPGGVQSSGAAGAVTRRFDLAGLPQPGGPVAVIPGDTWHLQYWFRDLVGATESNFSNGLRIEFR